MCAGSASQVLSSLSLGFDHPVPWVSLLRHQHPVDNAGLFSCMTFSWLSPLARIAHRKGELLMEDVWSLSKHESSEVNCRR